MQSVGYWYKTGKLFEVERAHIDLIMHYPEKFDMTDEYVRSIYAFHNERYGIEGKAREDLIKEALQMGWIRVRHYNRPKDYWSIQYNNWYEQKYDVKRLVETLIYDEKTMTPSDEVIFLGFGDNSREHYSFMNGGIKSFLNQSSGSNSNNDDTNEDPSYFSAYEGKVKKVKDFKLM